MTDLANIGIQPDRSRSTWAEVKAFPENVEIQLSGRLLDAILSVRSPLRRPVDPRSTRHASRDPTTGCRCCPPATTNPAPADDRVGHFLSTLDDFSTDVSKTPRVRYVTRWHLVKSDPKAEKSPPREPIIFWIAKSVPRQYRSYVRQGILEWNKAFERRWDSSRPSSAATSSPRTSSIRKIFATTPSAGSPPPPASRWGPREPIRRRARSSTRTSSSTRPCSAIGGRTTCACAASPVRSNWPTAASTRALFRLYAAELPELATAERKLNELFRQDAARAERLLAPREPSPENLLPQLPLDHKQCCSLGGGTQRQLGLLGRPSCPPRGGLEPGGKVPDRYIGEAIKEVVMHEVGHYARPAPQLQGQHGPSASRTSISRRSPKTTG